MEKKKLFSTLLGIGLAIATPLQASAQTSNTPMPPQVVTDGGVEALRAAQESAPIKVEKFQEARAVLKRQARSRKWREGYDTKRNRIIVIEAADFTTSNPATDSSFFIKREMAAKKAILSAKVAIIEYINQEMSAMDLVNMPGSDVHKSLGAERERLNSQLALQKEVLAQLLEKVDKAEADVLRGTTFGDRLNDLMVAAIKKLDKEYDANARDRAAKARYESTKANFEAAQKKYKELKEKAEALQGQVRERQESAIESMAKMPLYGSSVIMQTESWNNKNGRYQVAVMVCWSYVMERAARAIVTGEEYKIKPSATAKSVEDFLESQNLATMVGPRQYIDNEGNRWFLGITARSYDDELSSSERRQNKGDAEMFARQMATFCVFSDVESHKMAKQALESRGNSKAQRDVVAESYSETLTQMFKNKQIRGSQRLFSDEVTHPITGSTIYVTVYGLNSNAAKNALEAEKINYATKIMDNQYQTVERGRKAALRDAVNDSQNRQDDFDKGYNQQSKRINQELDSRKPVKPKKGIVIINKNTQTTKSSRQSTSGTFGGDIDINDNF